MPTFINDFASAAEVATGYPPMEITESVTGESVDLGPGDGRGFAVQLVGEVSAGATLNGHLEESHDEADWIALSGVTFAEVSASDDVQAIRFRRNRRYVRWVGDLAGEDAAVFCAVVIGEQRKTF